MSSIDGAFTQGPPHPTPAPKPGRSPAANLAVPLSFRLVLWSSLSLLDSQGVKPAIGRCTI